jgi:hypothetical protein
LEKNSISTRGLSYQMVLGVMGIMPPVGIAMILTHWYKGGKTDLFSVLTLVFGLAYLVLICLQLSKQG